MAKKITISVICSKGPDSKGFKSIDKLNALMGNYWINNMQRVMDSSPDLIILPENSDRFTDFSSPSYLEYIDSKGTCIDALSEFAKRNKTSIAYTSIRKHDTDLMFPFRNGIRLIDKSGDTVFTYDKNHVTIDENKLGVGYGTTSDIYEYDGIKTAFAICFDLNFDSLLEKYKSQNPDLFIFSSYYHGGLKQDRWAYYLGCHMASAISGNTGRIINPFGTVIAHTTNYYDYVSANINVDCKVVHLDYNMEKIAKAKRKYKHDLTVYDPGNVATVLLTYEANDKNINDVLDEFNIETYDEYLSRAVLHRQRYFEKYTEGQQ